MAQERRAAVAKITESVYVQASHGPNTHCTLVGTISHAE
jgi:hypothetical protein